MTLKSNRGCPFTMPKTSKKFEKLSYESCLNAKMDTHTYLHTRAQQRCYMYLHLQQSARWDNNNAFP